MPDNKTAALADRRGQVAVIFTAWRSGADQAGYAAAAASMNALAAQQPGYRGVDTARGDDGFGVTVSYWADEACAIAWRAHPRPCRGARGGARALVRRLRPARRAGIAELRVAKTRG